MGREEDNNYILHGPEPYEPLIEHKTLGAEIYEYFVNNGSTTYDVMVDAFTGRRLSNRQLLQDSCNLAEALKACGYGEGAIFSISSENSLEFFVPIFACLFNGSIMAPLNHFYTTTELNHTLNLTKPSIIFCARNIADKYIQLKEKLKFIERIIVIDSQERLDGATTLKEFLAVTLKGVNVQPEKFTPFNKDPSKTAAFVMCSSGTTGLPKGVMLSHKNIMVRVQQVRDPKYACHEEGEPSAGILPFFHAFGLIVSLTSFICKSCIIVFHKFDPDVFLNSIEKYKIAVLFLVPPLALFVIKTDKLKNYDLSSIKFVFIGAAPLSEASEAELKRRLQIDNVKQGYGLTETTLAPVLPQNGNVKSGSSGKVASYMSCKIRNPDTGRSLGPYEVGEICIKGPMVMMGYYGNEQATRETFTDDGWLKTGDLGYYDAEGYFYIVDRLKELIKYKGFQVAPAELEALLINHPKVADAGVVGLPDESCGELPVAFIIKKDGQEVTEKEIEKYIADQVSPQKQLRGGVIFVTSIPKSPSGKILRRELRLLLKIHRTKLDSKL